MSVTKFSINDVREALPKSDVELLCYKTVTLQICIIRPSDDNEANHLSSKFGVELVVSATEDGLEEASGHTFTPNRLFTLEELVGVLEEFGIEPGEKTWQVTDEFDSAPRIISDVSQIKELKK